MKTLLISPNRSTFAVMDKDENITDVTEKLEQEIYFYNLFVKFTGEEDLFIYDDIEVEDIFYHIAEKAYLTEHKDRDNHRLKSFNYTNQFTDNIKTKLLIAFTHIFLEACRKKLNSDIEVEYL